MKFFCLIFVLFSNIVYADVYTDVKNFTLAVIDWSDNCTDNPNYTYAYLLKCNQYRTYVNFKTFNTLKDHTKNAKAVAIYTPKMIEELEIHMLLIETELNTKQIFLD